MGTAVLTVRSLPFSSMKRHSNAMHLLPTSPIPSQRIGWWTGLPRRLKTRTWTFSVQRTSPFTQEKLVLTASFPYLSSTFKSWNACLRLQMELTRRLWTGWQVGLWRKNTTYFIVMKVFHSITTNRASIAFTLSQSSIFLHCSAYLQNLVPRILRQIKE